MKKLVILMVLAMLSAVVFAAKIVPLPDLNVPFFIKVDDSRLYISDGPTISIYSLKDFKLQKAFGKVGEGPREFKLTRRNAGAVMIGLTKDFIIANSVNKITYFNKDGTYIKEMPTSSKGLRFIPLGDGYVGEAFIQENKKNQSVRYTFDAQFNRVKELYRRPSFFQQSGDLNPFYIISPVIDVYKGKILINGVDNELYVYNAKGEKVKTITHDYKKITITQATKERTLKWFQTYISFKRIWPYIKGRLVFPEHYPGIRTFSVADDNIYVLTHLRIKDKVQFVIFDMEGKLVKKAMVPFVDKGENLWCPYTISGGNLYQLVENEEEESWDLHITEIK
ncbi:MAG: hypothetical protein GY765_27960 [bacterium]|nr:hypothetical protein [bacterium]